MTKLQPWDLEETYRLVRTRWGRDQEKLVRESARSINERKDFASYHFREAVRLSKTFERTHLAGLQTFLEIHAPGAERKRHAFELYIVKAGAHALALVQNIHAIPDILAHVVYFGTGQNLKPNALPEKEVYPNSVAGLLHHDRALARLRRKILQLQNAKGWSHLSAVANMGKHRSVIRSALSEDWTGTRKDYRELQVTSFGRFPPVSLRQLVEPEFDRLSVAIVNIGRDLNEYLRNARDA